MNWQNKTVYVRIALTIALLSTGIIKNAAMRAPLYNGASTSDCEWKMANDESYRQDTLPLVLPDSTFLPDSVFFTDTAALNAFPVPDVNAAAKNKAYAKNETSTFKPNPKRAYLMAAIFLGAGQVYNRQYWKLPIVYGGLAGFMYAITWNNKNYSDYSEAYFDLMADAQSDPTGAHPENWRQSWQNFTSDPASRLHDSYFQSQLKSGKDFYRRYRDLSIILGIAFYFICVADAYVDAQMFDFDVSPSLSFRITPEIRPETICHSGSFGVNICMTF